MPVSSTLNKKAASSAAEELKASLSLSIKDIPDSVYVIIDSVTDVIVKFNGSAAGASFQNDLILLFSEGLKIKKNITTSKKPVHTAEYEEFLDKWNVFCETLLTFQEMSFSFDGAFLASKIATLNDSCRNLLRVCNSKDKPVAALGKIYDALMQFIGSGNAEKLFTIKENAELLKSTLETLKKTL